MATGDDMINGQLQPVGKIAAIITAILACEVIPDMGVMTIPPQGIGISRHCISSSWLSVNNLTQKIISIKSSGIPTGGMLAYRAMRCWAGGWGAKKSTAESAETRRVRLLSGSAATAIGRVPGHTHRPL